MLNEVTYVCQSFEEHFTRLKDEPIVIYGLGKNTGFIVDKFPEYNIVGLMDQVRAGEKIFGKPVLTFEEVNELGVKAIIILARAANVPIIYRRISESCEKYGIDVYDINGIKQARKVSVWSGLPDIYDEINEKALYEAIDRVDVISFDIFDTLLMRTVLFPTDIFEIMEDRLVLSYGTRLASGFAKQRISAEQSLYLTMQPGLEDIYNKLKEVMGLEVIIAKEWMQFETDLEMEHLIARAKMRDIILYAIRVEKEICLTSDMYFSSDILRRFLMKNNYPIDAIPILVSNEQGVAKCNGLFRVLRNKYEGRKILHIGDNEDADIACARKYGVDECFMIRSAYSMLVDSVAAELLEHSENFGNRCCIGRFISKQFNNPFIFEKTKGRLQISTEYDIGYSFLAPIVSVFLDWLINRCQIEQIEELLLASRDGYLINILLNIIKDKRPNLKLPNYRYFYASRSVCLIAGLRHEEDIEYAASLAFSGSPEQMLNTRFGLDDNEVMQRSSDENDIVYILRHKDLIMSKAEKVKKNYKAYLEQDKSKKGKKIGFFDFVSSGTCQMALEQFLGWNMIGLYFARIHDEHKENLKIKSLCPDTCVYENQLAIMNKYFFMENVFTSFEPTLIAFDEEGTPLFSRENRSEKQLESLKNIQTGIIDCFKDSILVSEKLALNNLEFADIFIKYIDSEYTVFDLSYFQDNPLIDEFCNRSFNLVEI